MSKRTEQANKKTTPHSRKRDICGVQTLCRLCRLNTVFFCVNGFKGIVVRVLLCTLTIDRMCAVLQALDAICVSDIFGLCNAFFIRLNAVQHLTISSTFSECTPHFVISRANHRMVAVIATGLPSTVHMHSTALSSNGLPLSKKI